MQEEEVIAPVKAASQFAAMPTTTAATTAAHVASSTVAASEVDSARIYGSSYSGVSFGSAFSPDNLLLTDRRTLRSRSLRALVCLFEVENALFSNHLLADFLFFFRSKKMHVSFFSIPNVFGLYHRAPREACSQSRSTTEFWVYRYIITEASLLQFAIMLNCLLIALLAVCS